MEQGFFLAKELNISWSDVENMMSRDRMWLCARLEKWFKEQNEAQDREEAKMDSGGKGRLSVNQFT
jgi:hypothetical protein